MDWNTIRNNWQASGPAGEPARVLAQVHARDAAVRRQLRRRDLLETIVALPMLPFFGWIAWTAYTRGAWVSVGFATLITLWCAYVPVHLWRARRQLPARDPALAPAAYLALERDAMRVQARMLEQAWLWYVAPCVLGIVGLVVATRGIDAKGMIYSAGVFVFGALIAWSNRVAARRHFGVLADDIQREIDKLEEEEPS